MIFPKNLSVRYDLPKKNKCPLMIFPKNLSVRYDLPGIFLDLPGIFPKNTKKIFKKYLVGGHTRYIIDHKKFSSFGFGWTAEKKFGGGGRLVGL